MPILFLINSDTSRESSRIFLPSVVVAIHAGSPLRIRTSDKSKTVLSGNGRFNIKPFVLQLCYLFVFYAAFY